jgi:predicted dehydrogenase
MSGKDRREFLHKARARRHVFRHCATALRQSSGAFTVDPANTSTPEIKPTHSINVRGHRPRPRHIFRNDRRGPARWRHARRVPRDDPAQIADFNKKYPDVKLASEDEILNDKSIQLVAGAPIPDLRAPLGIRVMKAGKDYLADKPGITTLRQLADVRKAVKETGRKFAIMYSERLEVRLARVRRRAHQTRRHRPRGADRESRAASRECALAPAWFFDKARYGGILCDIGSHQADQFLYYTNSTKAKVVAAQTGNVAYPQYPKFEDFGDMVMSGNGGTGYVRVDWYTPDGLANVG